MGRISKLTGECYHIRNFDISITDIDENHFVAAGHLCDNRPKPTYRFTGEKRPVGKLHDLEIFLLIQKEGLKIEDVEVHIHSVPRKDCYKVDETLAPVIGLAVKSGFTKKVRSRVGGAKGCTHLVHLLSVMAPAVMQGYWAIRDKKPLASPEKTSKQAAKSAAFIRNSCFAWREQGDSYEELISYINPAIGVEVKD